MIAVVIEAQCHGTHPASAADHALTAEKALQEAGFTVTRVEAEVRR